MCSSHKSSSLDHQRNNALDDTLSLSRPLVPEVREWLLESYVDGDSKEKLLLDPESNMVYIMDRTENWPLVFGFIDDSGGIVQGLSSLLHEFITR